MKTLNLIALATIAVVGVGYVASNARESITLSKGDTLQTRFTIARDSVLSVVGTKIIAKKCGSSFIYLRTWKGSTVKSADTVAVTVGGCAAPPPDTQPTPPPNPPPQPPPPGALSLYYNSHEAGCGTDPSIVWCDDFETNGWYSKNCDVANASGGLLQTKGWCGTIYGEPITPPGAFRCGAGVGAAGTNCVADGGQHNGSIGSVNMADHNLGPNANGYNEIWLRYYIKALPGYVYGAQKMISFNSTPAGSGGISIGGSGSPFANGAYDTCPWWDCNNGTIYYYRQNMNLPALMLKDLLGHWVYVEMHVKMNTPGQTNGIWELWLNDCGANGMCTGAPTLRAQYFTVAWQGPAENKQIRSIWFENWANPGSVGTELYDQVMVKTNGPVGFVK